MYADPSRIRTRRVMLSFSDDEFAVVDALTNFTGEQMAPFLRELVLERAIAVLAGRADLAPRRGANEDAVPALQSA